MTQGHSHFERPTALKAEFPLARRISFVIVTAVIGMSTGALGFAILASLLLPSQFTNYSASYELLRRQPSDIQSFYSVEPLVEISNRSLVAILRHEDRAAGLYNNGLPNPNVYVGTGFIATSDGWIISGTKKMDPQGIYDIYKDGEFIPVEGIEHDNFTGLWFLKTGRTNFSPVEFAPSPLTAGSFLLMRSLSFSSPQIGVAMVDSNSYGRGETQNDFIYSSDSLALTLSAVSMGTPSEFSLFFDREGRLAGVGGASSVSSVPLISSSHISIALEDVLRARRFIPLGVLYVDAHLVSNLPANDGGVLLLSSDGNKAVTPRSLAAKAGLKEHDVLLAINGDTIKGSQDFSYLWRMHQHSSTVRFKIERSGKIFDIEISPE